MNQNNLTNEEILQCKENGFILIGKTGVGKTALLNILFGKDIGKVGHTTKSETKISNYYCIKENVNSKDNYFCIVDTPGLYDTSGKEADKNQKQDIIKLVSEKQIKVKGLLFLSNFQNERFDASEQLSLVQYNAIFPLKEFWKRIILVFTHYYGDPDGDSKEEIKERANKILGDIFKVIMNKTKNVSKSINYSQLNKKYINIYSKAKNKRQIENNLNIRKQLIIDIIEYSKLTPMFCKLQIYNFEKYELQPNDEFVYDCDFYVYLDGNNKVVHEDFNIKNKYKKDKNSKNNKKFKVNIEESEINSQGILERKTTKKEGIMKLFDNYKGEGLTILSIVGTICTGIFCMPALPLCIASFFGGTYLMKKKNDEKMKNQNQNQNQVNNFMLNQNIIDSINKYLFEP